MTSMTFDLPRRFPWPTLISVGIHGAVIMGLLYTSVHQVIKLSAPVQMVSISMVAAADPEPLAVVQPPAEPVAEPEAIPEPTPKAIPEPPKEAPLVIHKPEPKPRPKPVKKSEQQVKRDIKPASSSPVAPSDNRAPSRPLASSASVSSKAVSPAGPRALSRNQPHYPARAQALRIEGQVRVKFDVMADGRVGNVEILSAQPANMFERDVKSAMRRWRYEPGKPAAGLIVNIIFRINGTTQMD